MCYTICLAPLPGESVRCQSPSCLQRDDLEPGLVVFVAVWPDGVEATGQVRCGLPVSLQKVHHAAQPFVAVAPAHEIMDALAARQATTVSALTVDRRPLSSDASIGGALHGLDEGCYAVVVQDPTGSIIGWVRHRDVLTALSSSAP
jgi:hypothetical protein